MTKVNIREELDKAILASEKYIAKCIAAGRNEPDRSLMRSAWKAVGFYLPPRKNEVLKTTWRH